MPVPIQRPKGIPPSTYIEASVQNLNVEFILHVQSIRATALPPFLFAEALQKDHFCCEIVEKAIDI